VRKAVFQTRTPPVLSLQNFTLAFRCYCRYVQASARGFQAFLLEFARLTRAREFINILIAMGKGLLITSGTTSKGYQQIFSDDRFMMTGQQEDSQ